MGERAGDAPRYTAFLSYSHKDSAAAGRLHRRLETYRMPKRLIGAETARGPVPARLAPIFRDRDELPAATDLSETVREALGQSGALIILCSPSSAGSLWVAEEIETFRRLHPDRPILAAVLDGDPPDCFPAALRAFGQDGTWHEPLATDLRPNRDGRRLGLLKLVAGITGVGLDALVQRDAARRIRRVMAVTAAALIAMLAMAALALVALNARREAERQRAGAEGLVEFMLTDLRHSLRSVGRAELMAAVNRRAMRYYDDQRQLKHDPADVARRARLIHAMGDDELSLGDLAGAEARWRRAYRETSTLLAASPNETSAIYTHAQSEFFLGKIAYLRHDPQRARPYWQRYKALADRLLASAPENPAWLRESGYAEGNLCTIALARPPSPADAERFCRRALDQMGQAYLRQRNDPELILDLANRYSWLALALDASGHWNETGDLLARHDQLVQSLLRREPNNFDYLAFWMQAQFGWAGLFAAHGELGEARERIAKARWAAGRLHDRDPANANWSDWQQRIERGAAAYSGH